MSSKALPTAADEVRIAVTIDNYYDGLLMPEGNVERYRFFKPGGGEIMQLPPHITAEHGFGCYIEVTSEGKKNSILMDFGVTEYGVANNINAMGIDLTGLNAAVLSHGHFDHFGGLERVKELVGKKLPLYVGKEAFSRRYITLPGMKLDLGRLDPGRVEAAGYEIRQTDSPLEIVPGALIIGPIPRVTGFEQGSPILAVERDGQILQDDFVGELSLVFNISGKGLVILTACAHAGIVNTVKRAVELTGIEKVHAILGGFHLTGAPSDKIENTAEELVRVNPDQIVPMHCTGYQAGKLISDRMAGKFVLYSAGSRYSYYGM